MNGVRPWVTRAIASSSKTGEVCTADINGVDTTIFVARDQAVTAGDALWVLKNGTQWVAIGRAGTAAPAAPDEPPVTAPKPKPPKTGKKVIYPVLTRSYNTNYGWRDSDAVYQGEYGSNGNHYGCAFYGNRFDGLKGATCQRISVNIKRKSEGGQASAQGLTIRLYSNKTRPSGAPSITNNTSGPSLRWGAKDTDFVLPNTWGQALIDGSAGGLGVYESDGSPYVILHGRSSYSLSFVVTINWVRS